MLKRFGFICGGALLLVLGGCGTTATIENSYVDPTLKTKDLSGALVIGVAKKRASRIEFEDKFARALSKRGVRAIASYTLVPGDDISTEQAIASAQANQLDTILLSRYIGERTQEIYHPGTIYYGVTPTYGGAYNGRYGSYHGHAYEVAYEAPVTTTNRTVTVITDLYQVETEEHLWQAVSEAVKAGSEKELLDAFVRGFVNNMIELNVIN